MTTTPENRREAAQMLRQAASVMQQQGFTRHSYLDPRNGRVCLDGALMAAGIKEVVKVRLPDRTLFHLQGLSRDCPPEKRHLVAVHQIATSALIDSLPSVCREHKTGSCPLGDRSTGTATDQLPAAPARIHHYNDYVCDGGDEASLILVTAAEKIEADL